MPTSTQRYYESEGLLPAVERTPGGRRKYSRRDLEACRVIDCLKSSDLSVKQVKDFIDMAVEGDSTLPQRLALFEARRDSVEHEMRELARVCAVLDFKVWYYEQAAAAGTEGAVRGLHDDAIPARHRAARQYLADEVVEDSGAAR